MMKQFMITTLWILLGVMFVMAGGAKLMGQKAQVEHFAQWGYPVWFLYLTGIIEVGGGICLFIPKAKFYGIVVLSVTMVSAAMTHLNASEMGAFPVPLVLLCLLLVLAWTMRELPRKYKEDS
jgi:putative oxidoreductase